jgi:hypothetical protein
MEKIMLNRLGLRNRCEFKISFSLFPTEPSNLPPVIFVEIPSATRGHSKTRRYNRDFLTGRLPLFLNITQKAVHDNTQKARSSVSLDSSRFKTIPINQNFQISDALFARSAFVIGAQFIELR